MTCSQCHIRNFGMHDYADPANVDPTKGTPKALNKSLATLNFQIIPDGTSAWEAFTIDFLHHQECRGKALFEKDCGFCHGEDARGGDMGGNLIRSQIVLNDGSGEKLAPILLRGEGVEGTLMPKFNYTPVQISDLAGFLHSFRVNGYDVSRMRPETIVVGNAQAGKTFFEARCGSCHSATGDLKDIATRFADARTLQQRWLMPAAGGRGGGGTPVTVTVTPANGPSVTGRLVRIDDFIVILALTDGSQRTFRRDGDVPRVKIHDQIQAHRELLRVYADKHIHDVTAYLVTLK